MAAQMVLSLLSTYIFLVALLGAHFEPLTFPQFPFVDFPTYASLKLGT